MAYYAPVLAIGAHTLSRLKYSNYRRNFGPIIAAGSVGGRGGTSSSKPPLKPITELKFKPKSKFSSDELISDAKNSAATIRNRAKWSLKWFRSIIIPWRWTSWMVSIYLLCLSFVAEAQEFRDLSSDYACEHVEKYYAGVAHLRGEELKQKLHSVVSKHQHLSDKKVWDALMVLDAADVDNPEASAEVVEIYSSRIVPKRLAGKPEGWNREHLWPRSYGLLPGRASTDLHNIRPADVNVNSSRGNKFYGECQAYTSDCLKPANRESALDTEADKDRWAPPIQVRGDIARAIMYMAVCYGFNESSGGRNLRLSDSPNIANKEMGLLSTLLKWNALDPPSREEKLRNERICKRYQHNRNPFVDHPEFANLIWRSK